MDDQLKQAAEAIKAGNKARARQVLKSVLKDSPSAEAWYLAANAMESNEQAIACLKKALTIDEWHSASNRMLLKLEQVESIITRKPLGSSEVPTGREDDEVAPVEKPRTAPVRPVTPRKVVTQEMAADIQPLPDIDRKTRPMAYQRRESGRKMRRRFGCAMLLLLQISCGVLTLGLIGAFPGAVGTLTQFFGGPSPITDLDGTPIRDVPNAAATMQPSQSSVANGRNVDVMDHGYNHEYTFDARAGEEVIGYVQFMSLNAGNVPKNVIILDPDDDLVTSEEVCMFLGEEGLLGGEGNVSFTCRINKTGTWKVRILGVQGESIGAYFVGVERLD